MAEQEVLVINDIAYNTEGASSEALQLIKNLQIIQNELNRIKITHDITNIAKNTNLESVVALIESGESGLVVVEEENTKDA